MSRRSRVEFVAVAKLQADAFVTLDSDLARRGRRHRHDRTVEALLEQESTRIVARGSE
ncbi:MAG: hypothetical protein ABWX59_00415 [Microbacteriaceae bacterium]